MLSATTGLTIQRRDTSTGGTASSTQTAARPQTMSATMQDLTNALHNHHMKASSTPLCTARSQGLDQEDRNATVSLVATPLTLTSATMVQAAVMIILPPDISAMTETCRRLKESRVHPTARPFARTMTSVSSSLSGQRNMGSIRGGVTSTPAATR